MPGSAALACDSSIQQQLLWLFLAACGTSAFLVFRILRQGTRFGPSHVGLQLSYLANFWILHWVSVPVFLLPWYCDTQASYVVLGARESLYALLGLTAGILVAPMLFNLRLQPIGPVDEAASKRLRRFLLITGPVFYLTPSVPGVQAILSEGQQFVVAAVVLGLWQAYGAQDRRLQMKWLGFSLLFPMITIVRSGFLGFGMLALIPVLVLVFSWGRRFTFKTAMVGLLVAYFGLSFFVNYMRDRVEIRRVVWGQQGLSARIDRVANTFVNFEWFSPYETRHLELIESRLNQNYLVGAAVVYTDSTKEWAHGTTLVNAALAFIPRLVWANKPVNTSGNLVAKYTGLQFAPGTSVGVGRVLEFYVNFGSITVFLGFMLLGGALAWMDVNGINALRTGNFARFIPIFLVGLALQIEGDSLMETIASVAAGVVMGYVVNMFNGRQEASAPRRVGPAQITPSPVPFSR